MVRTIATAGTRIGIVTLAALGAFALPVGAAQASTTSQATLDGLQVREDVLEERLAVATPAQKPGLIAQILIVQAQEAQVQQQMDLANCP